ncbi:MAG: hypothetical protein KDD82_17870 [Planctomycetes bacterium]|nr:hypothetical protein [Planctomycetota bacterium]
MHKLWLGLLAGLLLAGGGFADTVFLKNGRSIKGKVIAENDDQVVVKTPGGRVPLPRKLIERIERTSAGQTALDMGRQRAREGDYERAREQFRLALDDPDPQVSSAARKELETLPAGSGPPRAAGARGGAGGWPPQQDQPLSVAGFRDEFGRPVSSRALSEKVVLIEIAGMHHPYSQAYAGGQQKGGFGGVTPQPDVASVQEQIARHAGVPANHPDLVVVQLLLAGPDGQTPPTLEQAGEWAAHFGHTRAGNVQLWVGTDKHLELSKDMFGIFLLVSPDGVVRFRSRNYKQLFPYIKKFIDAKHAPQAEEATPSAPAAGAHPGDDYGHVNFTNIYPESLAAPPAEAPYPRPIVLLPNPRSLEDVPADFRQWVNQAMTYVAQAALVKARAVAALKRGGDMSQAQADYKRDMGALERAVGSLTRPQDETITSARASLVSGFLTQRKLIEAAFSQIGQGKATYAQLRGSKQASEQQLMLGATAQAMLDRFDRLEPKTRESINTHFGALASFPP